MPQKSTRCCCFAGTEKKEKHDEDENVVDGERAFYDVAGEEFEAALGAHVVINPPVEEQRGDGPDDGPESGFARGDFMGIAMEDSEVEREEEKEDEVEADPEGNGNHRERSLAWFGAGT